MVTSDYIIFKGKLLRVMQRVWHKLDTKYRDFVVSYNRKVKHNIYIYEIDVQANFRALFKDKYSNIRYSTPREISLGQDEKLSLTFIKMISRNK